MKQTDAIINNGVNLGGSIWGLGKALVTLPFEIGGTLYDKVHNKKETNPAVKIVDDTINGADDLMGEAKQLLAKLQTKKAEGNK